MQRRVVRVRAIERRAVLVSGDIVSSEDVVWVEVLAGEVDVRVDVDFEFVAGRPKRWRTVHCVITVIHNLLALCSHPHIQSIRPLLGSQL